MGDVLTVLVISTFVVQLILVVSTITLARRIERVNLLQQAIHKQVTATDLSIQRVEKLADIETKISEKMKKLESPSVELQEFLADVMEHGCSIIRINPDSILIRGLRS